MRYTNHLVRYKYSNSKTYLPSLALIYKGKLGLWRFSRPGILIAP